MDHRVLGVSANLQQHITMTQCCIQRVVRETRHLLQLFRHLQRKAKPLIKQRMPHRQCNSEIIRRNVSAENAGIEWRQARIGRFWCHSALSQKSKPLSQQTKQPLKIGFIAGQHIKRHQHHCSLLWCQNARLMLTIKRLFLIARFWRKRTRRTLHFLRMSDRATPCQRQRANPFQ